MLKLENKKYEQIKENFEQMKEDDPLKYLKSILNFSSSALEFNLNEINQDLWNEIKEKIILFYPEISYKSDKEILEFIIKDWTKESIEEVIKIEKR